MSVMRATDIKTGLTTTISDSGKYLINREGIKYQSAVDVRSDVIYTEGDLIPVISEDPPAA